MSLKFNIFGITSLRFIVHSIHSILVNSLVVKYINMGTDQKLSVYVTDSHVKKNKFYIITLFTLLLIQFYAITKWPFLLWFDASKQITILIVV